jgi:predicted nuclease of predicted toxin-antitoxin system
MKLLADECVAASTVHALRDAGCDIEWISETLPGAHDQDVLAHAVASGRLLLTADKDFGELTIRFGHPCLGIILMSLTSLPAAERAARTVAALQVVAGDAAGHIVVIEPRRIRRRALRYP